MADHEEPHLAADVEAGASDASGSGSGSGIDFAFEAVGSDAGERLDLFLVGRLPSEFSRGRVQALIRAGRVMLSGRAAKPKEPVKPGDRIRVSLPPPEPGTPAPEAIPVRVLYEDAHLVVVDKEVGMVVHPGSGNRTGTLVNALLHRFGSLPAPGGDVDRPGIVHRLDKETSGCLVVARDDGTHRSLVAQFSNRMVSKHYLAVVAGVPQPPEGTVENRIGRNPYQRQKMAVVTGEAGKPAVTRYRVGTVHGGDALVHCDLRTGRTHQIRVHMKHLGHPILGDPVYGKAPPHGGVDRLMLHAWKLGFDHPATGERLDVESPPPPAFSAWTAGNSDAGSAPPPG